MRPCRENWVLGLALHRQHNDNTRLRIQHVRQGLSVGVIGRLISGFGERQTSLYREAVTDPTEMARQCQVTFRPLPKGYHNDTIEQLRTDLAQALRQNGVNVIPWKQATVTFRQKGILPIINRPLHFTTLGVRRGIHAVIDVERPRSFGRRLCMTAVELLYCVTSCLTRKRGARSIPSIARLSLWADDHPAKYLQDHVNTQIVTLTEFQPELVDANLPYSQRIGQGLAALADHFSQIIVGTHGQKVSILNMNLTDSVVDRANLDRFVRYCLVPKLFVPVTPLLPSQFEVGYYDPQASDSARGLLCLSAALSTTGLLPSAKTLCNLLKRKSRRDMVEVIMEGRTGVSFGFVAFIEPPRYVGPREISAEQWRNLPASTAYAAEEIRRGQNDRLYARIQTKSGIVFRQIPDLWIACSRSGCDKTRLRLDRDIIRIGYDGTLHVHLPSGRPLNGDLNPSYDVRVMLALALSAALHAPQMLQNGGPLFHFHGYPHRDWLQNDEACVGAENPAVPCGTAEAGVFNFQAMSRLINKHGAELRLVCIIEPDHGTNILAPNLDYLISRIREGVDRSQLVLGGQHFSRYKEVGQDAQPVAASAAL